MRVRSVVMALILFCFVCLSVSEQSPRSLYPMEDLEEDDKADQQANSISSSFGFGGDDGGGDEDTGGQGSDADVSKGEPLAEKDGSPPPAAAPEQKTTSTESPEEALAGAEEARAKAVAEATSANSTIKPLWPPPGCMFMHCTQFEPHRTRAASLECTAMLQSYLSHLRGYYFHGQKITYANLQMCKGAGTLISAESEVCGRVPKEGDPPAFAKGSNATKMNPIFGTKASTYTCDCLKDAYERHRDGILAAKCDEARSIVARVASTNATGTEFLALGEMLEELDAVSTTTDWETMEACMNLDQKTNREQLAAWGKSKTTKWWYWKDSEWKQFPRGGTGITDPDFKEDCEKIVEAVQFVYLRDDPTELKKQVSATIANPNPLADMVDDNIASYLGVDKVYRRDIFDMSSPILKSAPCIKFAQGTLEVGRKYRSSTCGDMQLERSIVLWSGVDPKIQAAASNSQALSGQDALVQIGTVAGNLLTGPLRKESYDKQFKWLAYFHTSVSDNPPYQGCKNPDPIDFVTVGEKEQCDELVSFTFKLDKPIQKDKLAEVEHKMIKWLFEKLAAAHEELMAGGSEEDGTAAKGLLAWANLKRSKKDGFKSPPGAGDGQHYIECSFYDQEAVSNAYGSGATSGTGIGKHQIPVHHSLRSVTDHMDAGTEIRAVFNSVEGNLRQAVNQQILAVLTEEQTELTQLASTWTGQVMAKEFTKKPGSRCPIKMPVLFHPSHTLNHFDSISRAFVEYGTRSGNATIVNVLVGSFSTTNVFMSTELPAILDDAFYTGVDVNIRFRVSAGKHASHAVDGCKDCGSICSRLVHLVRNKVSRKALDEVHGMHEDMQKLERRRKLLKDYVKKIKLKNWGKRLENWRKGSEGRYEQFWKQIVSVKCKMFAPPVGTWSHGKDYLQSDYLQDFGLNSNSHVQYEENIGWQSNWLSPEQRLNSMGTGKSTDKEQLEVSKKKWQGDREVQGDPNPPRWFRMCGTTYVDGDDVPSAAVNRVPLETTCANFLNETGYKDLTGCDSSYEQNFLCRLVVSPEDVERRRNGQRQERGHCARWYSLIHTWVEDCAATDLKTCAHSYATTPAGNRPCSIDESGEECELSHRFCDTYVKGVWY